MAVGGSKARSRMLMRGRLTIAAICASIPLAVVAVDGAEGLGRHLHPVDDGSQVSTRRATTEPLLDDLRE